MKNDTLKGTAGILLLFAIFIFNILQSFLFQPPQTNFEKFFSSKWGALMFCMIDIIFFISSLLLILKIHNKKTMVISLVIGIPFFFITALYIIISIGVITSKGGLR